MTSSTHEAAGQTTNGASNNGTAHSNGSTARTRIAVYCGASAGKSPVHVEAAQQLGRVLAANNIDLGESPGGGGGGERRRRRRKKNGIVEPRLHTRGS
jgi:hypothetical protein